MSALSESEEELTLENQPQLSLRIHWLRGAGVGVILQGMGLALAFGSSVFLARALGPAGLGQYSYVLAIVAVLSVIATLGLPTVVSRLLAGYGVRSAWGLARGLMRWSNLVVGGVGLLFGLGLIVFGLSWDGGSQGWLYIFAAPLIVVLAWTNLRQRALQGLHHPVAAQLPEQIAKHLIFLMVGGAIWLAGQQWVSHPNGVMAVWLFASTASLLFGMVILRRFAPPPLKRAETSCEYREWMSIALPILLADALGVLFGNSDTILLGWFRPAEEVGIYQVALRLSGLMLVLLGASNWVLAPWFSRFHAAGEIERFQSVVTRTTRLIFGATLLTYLVIAFFGEPLLRVFFGASFVEAYPLLLILGAGQLINVAAGPVVTLLAMTGGQRELAWGVGVVALVNMILCGLLILEFGMMGAAVAVAVSTSGYNILLARVVKRRSGIGPTIFG